MQQGKIKWTRQEALARIVAIEMIDLPLSDAEGSIENELKNKDGKHINERRSSEMSSSSIHDLFIVFKIYYIAAVFSCI